MAAELVHRLLLFPGEPAAPTGRRPEQALEPGRKALLFDDGSAGDDAVLTRRARGPVATASAATTAVPVAIPVPIAVSTVYVVMARNARVAL